MLLTVGGAQWVAAQVATPPPARREPMRSLENEHPPLFFREDWKLDPNAPNVNKEREPEHPIVQGDVVNPNLEVRVYGDAVGTRPVLQPENRDTRPGGGGEGLVYVMSLLCGTNLDRDDQSGKVVLGPSTHANCLITLRDRNNDVDLSGVATLRPRIRFAPRLDRGRRQAGSAGGVKPDDHEPVN